MGACSAQEPHQTRTVLAGHAGDVLGDSWYIVGGGNNTSGCTDMLALDLTPLAADNDTQEPLTWSVVDQQASRSAIVSEGLTVEAVPSAKCLLAFGGYNGKYQNALQVYKPGALSSLAVPTCQHYRDLLLKPLHLLHDIWLPYWFVATQHYNKVVNLQQHHVAGIFGDLAACAKPAVGHADMSEVSSMKLNINTDVYPHTNTMTITTHFSISQVSDGRAAVCHCRQQEW